MRKNKKESNTTSVGIIFVLLLIVVVFISFIFKTVDIVKKSQFGDTQGFVIALDDKNFVSVSGDDKISILSTSEKVKSIPVDARINGVEDKIDPDNLKSSLFKSFMKYNSIKTDLTIIDLARINWIVRSIPSKSITYYSDTDKALEDNIFHDSKLSEENLKIEIVNSTKTSGLASKWSEILTNSGANVILVANDREVTKVSKILYRERNYTIRRLESLMNIQPSSSSSERIADIKILLGEDIADK